jgi:hypothetical protein
MTNEQRDNAAIAELKRQNKDLSDRLLDMENRVASANQVVSLYCSRPFASQLWQEFSIKIKEALAAHEN